MRPLTELRTKLSENKAKIKNNKEKLQEAYLIQKKLNELTEKNRIYDELETKYGKQRARIGQLLKQCEGAGPAEAQSLLKRILLLGTYIKRAANLYFLVSSNVTVKQEDGLWLIRTLIGGVNDA